MDKTRNRSPADTEVIAVLIAISHVSARLAREPLDPCRRQTTIGRRQRECQKWQKWIRPSRHCAMPPLLLTARPTGKS